MQVKVWIDDNQWEDSLFAKRDWHKGFLAPNNVITIGFHLNIFTVRGKSSNEKVLDEIIPDSGIYKFQGKIQQIYDMNWDEPRKEAIIDCGFPIRVNYPYLDGVLEEYDSLFGFGTLWGETSYTIFPTSPIFCRFNYSNDYTWGKGDNVHLAYVSIEKEWKKLTPDYKLHILKEHKPIFNSNKNV